MPSEQRHADFEDTYRENMAAVAPIENEEMRRIMGGSATRGHVLGLPMDERADAFAAFCGSRGATVAQAAEALGFTLSTVKTHARKAMQTGKVRKVQASHNAVAVYYDARQEQALKRLADMGQEWDEK